MILLTALSLAAAALSAQTTNTINYDALGARGHEIENRIEGFDRDSNYHELWGALGVLNRLTVTNEDMSFAVLAVNLEILNRSVAGIDPAWDIKTARRPRTKVAPRLPGDELGLPGADPASISDPVVRKKYEEDIAENQKAVDAFERQIVLRKTIDGCMFRARNHLAAIANARDKRALDLAADNIKLRVKDEKTQTKLLSVITNALNKTSSPR